MFKSITLGELQEFVKDAIRFGHDEESVICFSSDYGDHCHTQQVHELSGEFELQKIDKSGYSKSGYAIKDEEYQRPDKEYQEVLVLS
jgi:hypothetical protein